jgi:hypothetical protein
VLDKLHVTAVQVLRQLFRTVGGVLTSQRAYDELISQRDRAVMELVEHENLTLQPGLVGIVFSKDRALQLYSLLHSYRDLVSNPVALTVIYAASTAAHSEAYEQVKEFFSKACPTIDFVNETEGFRATLTAVLAKIQARNIFFLVDDIVFIRNVDLRFAAEVDARQYVLSLRHSPALTRSYTANMDQLPPALSNSSAFAEMLQFRWFEQGNEWSDPWSVDGQILSTAEVRVITRISDFVAPNSYEAALKSFNSLCTSRKGLCYLESKILNLPINRVQNENKNLSGKISPEFLLTQWNEGMMLDTRGLRSHIPLSPHEEHPAIFTKRPDRLDMPGKWLHDGTGVAV